MEIGERFQVETSHIAGAKGRARPQPMKVVELPKPDLGPAVKQKGLWKVIESRRSRREFDDGSIDLSTLSLVLWACQGVTEEGRGHSLRAAPSAGALYPNDTYLVANRVDGLEPGLYWYEPKGHTLVLLREGELGGALAKAALGQESLAEGAFSLVWCAVMERATWKYKQRAYRYVYLDAGHICENLYLACEALGLGCCGVAAFSDDAVNALIGADGTTEFATYLAAVGRPSR